MTAVYGGGYEAGVSDPLAPVRAASLRGQLRWWWRAACGASSATYRELKDREDAIWGATDRRSPVTVEVLRAQLAPGVDAKRLEQGRPAFEQPQYALFPAQSDPVRKIHKSGSFTLRLSYSEGLQEGLQKEVETALRAFFWFGGVGARTRRGLGALVCDSASGFGLPGPNFQLPGLAPCAARPPAWDVLSGSKYVLGPKGSPQDAWVRAIDLLKGYRQFRRGGQGNRPGRSYWPEPDAIRNLRKAWDPNHRQRVTTDDVFPRAQFGLPIVFHFKSHTDPQDNMLVIDDEHDRMPSPLILKPLVISEREAYPLCLVLNGPASPRELTLQQDRAPDLRVPGGNLDLLEGLVQTAERDWQAKRRIL